MECSEFEAILQDRLDRRLPLPLSAEARAHLRLCLACEQDYRFFQQLAQLTHEPIGQFPTAAEQSAPPSEQSLDHVIGRCVAALGDEAFHSELSGKSPVGDHRNTGGTPTDESSRQTATTAANDDRIPTAPLVRLPAGNRIAETQGLDPKTASQLQYGRGVATSRSARAPRIAEKFLPLVAAAVAALLLVSVGWTVWQLTPRLGLGPQASAGSAAESISPSDESAVALAGSPRLAGPEPAPVTSGDLREMARNWDDSVVAFDRGWQQMAAGRVRAHQIPGMQPAVYPITGAVEAFRKNWIRRNPDGLAAGLQW